MDWYDNIQVLVKNDMYIDELKTLENMTLNLRRRKYLNVLVSRWNLWNVEKLRLKLCDSNHNWIWMESNHIYEGINSHRPYWVSRA